MGWPASSANSQKVFAAIQDAQLQTRVIMLVGRGAQRGFPRSRAAGLLWNRSQTDFDRTADEEHSQGARGRILARPDDHCGSDPPSGEEESGRRQHGQRGSGCASRAGAQQREREIVVLVAQGFKNKEMAERMFISEQTVKNHLHNIFDKLGVSDRLELALYAIHHNLHEQT